MYRRYGISDVHLYGGKNTRFFMHTMRQRSDSSKGSVSNQGSRTFGKSANFDNVGHECGRGCIHWCATSPTKAHHDLVRRKRFGASVGTCKHCGRTKTYEPEIAALAELESESKEVAKEKEYEGFYVQQLP